jgi:hypothetical protein
VTSDQAVISLLLLLFFTELLVPVGGEVWEQVLLARKRGGGCNSQCGEQPVDSTSKQQRIPLVSGYVKDRWLTALTP